MLLSLSLIFAISESCISIPRNSIYRFRAATPVVPVPAKGSRIRPLGGQVATIARSITFKGKPDSKLLSDGL